MSNAETGSSRVGIALFMFLPVGECTCRK